MFEFWKDFVTYHLEVLWWFLKLVAVGFFLLFQWLDQYLQREAVSFSWKREKAIGKLMMVVGSVLSIFVGVNYYTVKSSCLFEPYAFHFGLLVLAGYIIYYHAGYRERMRD